MPDPDIVTALLRGVDVLKTLGTDWSQSIRELHTATGLPKPALVRLQEPAEG
jgi:IclR family transcriptional regulator, mhp operon transcriptional activator